MHPAVFSPGAVVGSAGDAPGRVTNAEGLGNSLIHIYDTTATVTVGNPLGTTTAIDLRTRPISLPADWAIDVTPQQVMLAPGEQTTVTVTLLTGAPIAQGSVPRMAVEGWAGLTLLGGVTVDVVAPAYTTLTFPCASIDECYTALGATLPDPSAAPSKKARRTALKLQKRYKALGALLAKAAAASGKKRTRRYAKAGKVLQALDRAAQRADGKKTLAVPFAPIDAAVTALRAQMTATAAPTLTAGRRSHVTRRQDMHAVGDVRS